MAKKKTQTALINVVLDKSGSMGTITDATISGFNEFLHDQQADGALFSLTMFDTRFQLVHNAEPVKDVPDLDRHTYMPSGNTALYDAIGASIAAVKSLKAQPERVVFVILTDGQENSSREYTQRQIFDAITEQQAAGWQFIFLGSDQDAYASGASMGVSRGTTSTFTSSVTGTQTAYRTVSPVVSAYVTGASSTATLSEEDKKKIEKAK